jgi:hypothetical protein
LPKPVIKIHFQNGLSFEDFKSEVFDIEGLSEIYHFEESADPDFIIFGPYGNDIPVKNDKYIRVGYFCENIKPDLSVCEWAFGVPHASEIDHPRYTRIIWHGFDPGLLIKDDSYDPEKIYEKKKCFCNFLYAHHVSFREKLFTLLSAYKKVDAPGKSMNNMASIDDEYLGDKWQRKRQFLRAYKFTIAFENYIYPGYQTEKLYDAMMANSIPIYFGDPLVGEIFNTASFVNAHDYIKVKNQPMLRWLEKISQPDFVDIRPFHFKNPAHRVKRKLKALGRGLKMYMQFLSTDFKPLIDRVVELDSDKTLYLDMLKQPWLINNSLPADASLKNRWIEIFDHKYA